MWPREDSIWSLKKGQAMSEEMARIMALVIEKNEKITKKLMAIKKLLEESEENNRAIEKKILEIINED